VRCQYYVGSLFRTNVDSAHDEESRDARKDGSIYDSQPFGAMHPKVTSQHSAVGPSSNRTGARSVMAPGVIANETLQVSLVVTPSPGNSSSRSGPGASALPSFSGRRARRPTTASMSLRRRRRLS
jgi:hypothetical protein